MPEPLQTQRLVLRPFVDDDAEALFAIFREPEVGRWVGGAHATIEQSRDLIAINRDQEERNGFGMWAVEREGELIGEAGLQLLERRGPDVEVGWVIAKPHWGNGYASESGRAWLDLAWRRGVERVVATVLPENLVSHRVARKIGMKREGRRFVHEAEHDLYVALRPGPIAAA